MCSSTVSSSLTIHVFRWRKLPLMFNSCHVTRLRRTSLRLLLYLFLRLHRGRCHELYKHVPPSRGKAFGTVVALEFGGDLRGEDRRKQTFVTLSLSYYVCFSIVSGTVWSWTTTTTIKRDQFSPEATRNEPRWLTAQPPSFWNAKNHASRYF